MKRPRKQTQHVSHDGDTAFRYAVSMGNGKDLQHLLGVVTGLSAIAGLTTFEDPLGRRCHYQVSRIVADAVLRSTASFGLTEWLQPDQTRKLVNNAIDVTHDPEPLDKLRESDGTDRVRLEGVRFLGQLGQIQIAPFEDSPPHMAGAAVGLFEAIPSRHRALIEQRIPGANSVLASPPSEVLGLSVHAAAHLYLLLLIYYSQRWRSFNLRLPLGEGRIDAALVQLDEAAHSNFWAFTPNLLQRLSNRTETEIAAFLSMFSRSPEDLRALLELPGSPFQLGSPAFRMLPVDRFPIIALPGRQYVIPNITIFRKSFPHVIDFSLLERFANSGLREPYEHVRGASLELYIADLIANRLPNCQTIPEIEYKSPRGRIKSPDLCILDSADGSLVAVEAKARRLSPMAAVSGGDGDLDRNHAPSLLAIKNLPRKLEGLFTAPEFKPWQEDLKNINRDRAVLVSVVIGAIFFHDEIEPLRAKLDMHHPLHAMPLPFCFLDLAVFERAVEVAHEHGIPLAQLLREHHEDTLRAGGQTTAARLFRNRWDGSSQNRYSQQFLAAPNAP